MNKKIIITIIIAGLGLWVWQIYQRSSDSQKNSLRRGRNVPVAVEVEPVKKATIREIGSYTGSLNPVSEFIMAPKISGRLEKILVNIGDVVSGGQLAAVLDDGEYRQQVVQSEAELMVAQANLQERENILQNAKREYERTQLLRKKKIASESQLDSARSELNTQQAKLKVTVAQVTQKKASLKMAKVRLSYAQIMVPENNTIGHRVVGERFVDEGAMLAPNTPIVTILDIGKLIAVIHVIERDYPKIQTGLEAVISTDAYPGRSFPGKVIRIAPLIKEKSREARVEVEILNEQILLKPGMFARVRIQFDEHENVIVVPASALIKRNGDQGVFLADLQEKKAKFIPITTGIVNGSHVEVLSPPITGMVVTLGHHLLEDGAMIILPGSKPDAAKSNKGKKSGSGRDKRPAGKKK